MDPRSHSRVRLFVNVLNFNPSDIAMQLVGKLCNYFLGKRKEKVNILVGTSGDTGTYRTVILEIILQTLQDLLQLQLSKVNHLLIALSYFPKEGHSK
jgi:hypothetical protein